jgi:uracil-DNA glycosylase family protein
MSKATNSAEPYLPKDHALPVLRAAVQHCRGCDLYKHATQAVFGEIGGEASSTKQQSKIVFIGEQPGDQEDKEGRPFVGPAGKLLDRALAEANIDRRKVYVTNSVKHFKWEPRGKLRIHKKPSMTEINACRPWLDAELDTLRPRVIVCLGAIAAQSLLGSKFRISKSHGTVQRIEGLPPVIATAHPASILRAITDDDRHRQMAEFIADLKQVAHLSANH